MLGASRANVYPGAAANPQHLPLFALLAWSMAAGAVFDVAARLRRRRAAGVRLVAALLGWASLYLALFASVLAFSLYYPVVRRIGPAKAAYSSMIVPIIAMGFSTWLEDYRWTAMTVAGVAWCWPEWRCAEPRKPPRPADAG